jgi:outer membrane protein assembly factor BamA
VKFAVTEGPPTLIDTVRVVQAPALLSARQIRRSGLPRAGQPLDLTALDSLRTRVRRTLWDRGYGNAVVADTAPPVDSLHVALEIDIQAGPRTTVDSVVVNGNHGVTTRTIRRLVGLGHGDLYRRADILAAQRRLYKSELFRQALIMVPDSADSAKQVVVNVREAPFHAVQAGGGFSTVEFLQLQGNFTLFNFIGSARRVDFRSAVGNLFARPLYGHSFGLGRLPPGATGTPEQAFLRPTWQFSATMTQPWFFSTRNSLGLSVFSNRRSVPNIVVDVGTGGSLTFTRRLLSDIPASLTYRYERTRVEAGELYFCVDFGYCRLPTIHALQSNNSLSPLIFGVRADRTDDPLAPHTGYTARLDAEYAAAATASDWRYHREQGELAWYARLGRGVLVIHANGGRVASLGSSAQALGVDSGGADLLHPRVRFYAGGSRSVRGYAEGQLGPRVLTIDPAKLTEVRDSAAGPGCTTATITAGTCNPNVLPSSDFTPRPVGGNSLLEGTIEYRRGLSGNLGAAVFVDGGRVGAGNLPSIFHARSAITPGFGFRYASPIGPVRVDLGIRPRTVEELPVVTQLRDSANNLRLVQLATPKRYDPTEGSNGFLKGLTSRLVLHLYIGEAY